jgi:hypothetical protein
MVHLGHFHWSVTIECDLATCFFRTKWALSASRHENCHGLHENCMASMRTAMASTITAMASMRTAMASTRTAMASDRIAMAATRMSVASTGTAGLGGGGGSDVHLGHSRFLVFSILHLTQLILLDGGMLRGEVSASGEGPFCPKEAGGQITLNGHRPVEVA